MLLVLLSKLLLVFVAFAMVTLAKYVRHLMVTRNSLRSVPGPLASSIVWGEEMGLYYSSPGSLYVQWHKAFGKVVRFTGAFGHQVLSITDPRAINFILGEAIYDFPKPEGVRAWFKATLGEGILWVEGKQAHEKQRRTLAPTLNLQAVRDLTPTFFETSAKLTAQWIRILDRAYTDEIEIEATDWAGRFALDTIGLAAFAYDFGSLNGGPHALAEALDGLTNNEHKRSSFYMRALFWLVPSVLNIGKKGEMIRQTKRELGDIGSKMWQDAKKAGDSEGKTLMALMLADDHASNRPLSEGQVVSQMRTIISAGYETVSSSVAWVLYELACHPQLQAQLREEVSAVQNHTLDALNNQPLLDAVLKESLRLHPPILENHHEAGKTISIPLSQPIPGTNITQLVIPKGTLLAIPVGVIQTDPEIWGPDPYAFRPERWFERKSEFVRKGREFLAFGEGPRACIGRSFATAEIKALIVTVLQQFSFTCIHNIEPFQSFVVRPRIRGQSASSLPLLVRRL